MANKKQRDTAAADAEMKARREASGDHGEGDDVNAQVTNHGDIFAGEEEDDVIF